MPTNGPRRPTKADRMLVARYLRMEATMMRGQAEKLRAESGESEVMRKIAAQQETRAERLERVAEWMTNV